jgi:hypothetical protein
MSWVDAIAAVRAVARRNSEYQRAANLFCDVQPKAERHFTQPSPCRSSPECAVWLVEIAASYPEAGTTHLVMDDLISHSCKALPFRCNEKNGGRFWERFTVPCTSKQGIWLSQAKIEISLSSCQ